MRHVNKMAGKTFMQKIKFKRRVINLGGEAMLEVGIRMFSEDGGVISKECECPNFLFL